MNRKLDPNLFYQNLQALPENTPIPIPEELNYLMKALVTPLLNDQAVELSDLDYDQFDEDDLESLKDYLYKLTQLTSWMHQVKNAIQKAPSFCSSHPVFC